MNPRPRPADLCPRCAAPLGPPTTHEYLLTCTGCGRFWPPAPMLEVVAAEQEDDAAVARRRALEVEAAAFYGGGEG